MSLARTVYSGVMRALQPWLMRKLKRRAQHEPLYGEAMEERLGTYTSAPWVADGRTVWVHAVSLGETHAAALLLQALRAQRPGLRVLLTHGTATGREAGAALLQPGDAQVWLPWDTPAATRAFLAHHRPAIGVVMETELWPNLIDQAQRLQVPLVLANARLSEKSLQQALRLPFLAKPAYAALSAVLAQTDDDASRLRRVGAKVTAVTGNMKFDAQPNEAQRQQGQQWRAAGARPVVMLASSRQGEEALCLAQWVSWLEGVSPMPDVQWLVVPRHPQRFDEVASLLAASGLSVSRRSTWGDAPTPAQVWLGDSLGEMALYYGLSDVALLGGSFEPLGGQNLIEAAACGCPIIMGPHTFNFAQAAAWAQQAGAAVRSPDMAHAMHTAVAMLGTPALARMQVAALGFAQAHRGAVARTLQAMDGLLPH